MKIRFAACCILFTLLSACRSDSSNEVFRLLITFDHHWNESQINRNGLSAFVFRNAANELLSIERLRYLLSAIAIEMKDDSRLVLKAYHLVDITREESLQIAFETFVSPDQIKGISFVFGLPPEANRDGVYPDLNAVLWNVPTALGGGYHFMQLDGKFKVPNQANAIGYNFHAIQAVDNATVGAAVFHDTFFSVSKDFNTSMFEQQVAVRMNVAEWFVNPHLWRLEEAHTMLMPDFEAQKRIAENGKSVFSMSIQ